MDSREFLGFTGSAAVGCAMGREAMAAVGLSYVSPLTLRVEGDKAAEFSVAVLFEGRPITAVKTGELVGTISKRRAQPGGCHHSMESVIVDRQRYQRRVAWRDLLWRRAPRWISRSCMTW